MKSFARFFSRAVSANRQAIAFLYDAEAIVQAMTMAGASARNIEDEQRRSVRELDDIVEGGHDAAAWAAERSSGWSRCDGHARGAVCHLVA